MLKVVGIEAAQDEMDGRALPTRRDRPRGGRVECSWRPWKPRSLQIGRSGGAIHTPRTGPRRILVEAKGLLDETP
jgi:hypothetical protein